MKRVKTILATLVILVTLAGNAAAFSYSNLVMTAFGNTDFGNTREVAYDLGDTQNFTIVPNPNEPSRDVPDNTFLPSDFFVHTYNGLQVGFFAFPEILPQDGAEFYFSSTAAEADLVLNDIQMSLSPLAAASNMIYGMYSATDGDRTYEGSALFNPLLGSCMGTLLSDCSGVVTLNSDGEGEINLYRGTVHLAGPNGPEYTAEYLGYYDIHTGGATFMPAGSSGGDVPVPGAFLLLGSGMAGLFVRRRTVLG